METPKVTPKQLEILLFLYRFRFLNRVQIQKLLNHKDPKTINTWLKDLNTRNIIGRHYSNKLKENTKPAIYYIAAKSKTILLAQNIVDPKIIKQRIYKEKERSQRLIDHCITLADFYLRILEEKDYDNLHFFTKTDLSKHYYLPYNRPDAYVAKETSKEMKRYFLEIIDDGTPRFIVRRKIEQYIDYYDSKKWQEATNYNFPTILLLNINVKNNNFLQTFIQKKLEEEFLSEISFYIGDKDYSWSEVILE